MKARQSLIKDVCAIGAVLGAIAIGISGADAATVIRTVTGSHTATVKTSNAIDTSNREAVRQRFLNDYVANDIHLNPNNGSNVDTCEAGLANPVAAQSVEKALNFFRGMAGVDALSLDTTANHSKYAQAAALNMAANSTLTHSPKASSKCYSVDAATGAAVSNLSASAGQTPSEQILWYFMDWSGRGGSTMQRSGVNDLLGHRLALLNPALHQPSYGNVDGYNAITVGAINFQDDQDQHDVMRDDANSPKVMSWPTAGYFPASLLTSNKVDNSDVERWHVGFKGADTTKAKVTVTDPKGKQITVRQEAKGFQRDGYGLVIFKFPQIKDAPKGTSAVAEYKVKVTGIAGTSQSSYSYSVKLFDPMITTNGSKPQVKVLEGPRIAQNANAQPAKLQITGDGPMKFQWQRSNDNGKTWNDIHDKYSNPLAEKAPQTANYIPAKGTCKKYGVLGNCPIESKEEAASYRFRVRVSNQHGETYSEPMKYTYYGFENTAAQRKGNLLEAKLVSHGDGDSVYQSEVTWVDGSGKVVATGQTIKITKQLKGKYLRPRILIGLSTFEAANRASITLGGVQL